MISIVDDDAFVRDSLADLIRSLGYRALTFGSAEEFLASGRVPDTTCLITDLQMPGCNGLELQSHLLAEGYRTPVVFVTAFPKESDRTRALNAGAVAFLSKPFKEESLIASVKRALQTYFANKSHS
jgi:FixJ family two-component response regulator